MTTKQKAICLALGATALLLLSIASPRPAPIVFVQEVHKTQSGAASSISQNLTATTGNTLLVTCGAPVGAITSVTDGKNSYTKDASSTRTNAQVAIFRASSITGGALTVSCNGGSNNQWDISVAEYSGMATATVDASTTAAGGAASAGTDAGILASHSGDLLFSTALLNTNTEPSSISPSDGYSPRGATGTAGVDLGVSDQVPPSAGCYPTGIAFNGVEADEHWAAAAVSYRQPHHWTLLPLPIRVRCGGAPN